MVSLRSWFSMYKSRSYIKNGPKFTDSCVNDLAKGQHTKHDRVIMYEYGDRITLVTKRVQAGKNSDSGKTYRRFKFLESATFSIKQGKYRKFLYSYYNTQKLYVSTIRSMFIIIIPLLLKTGSMRCACLKLVLTLKV